MAKVGNYTAMSNKMSQMAYDHALVKMVPKKSKKVKTKRKKK